MEKLNAYFLISRETQGAGHSINDRGQVAGWSGVCVGPPFISHALLWDHGKRINLGSLGGRNSQAYNINNKGEVVGFSGNDDGSIIHGFLWRDGRMHDLGVLPGDVFSFGAASNDTGEIVGASGDADGNERAVIWHNNKMIDLNTLISSNSPIFLLEGDYINSRGQIVGIGYDLVTGQIHGYVATPNYNYNETDDQTTIDTATTFSLARVLPETVRNRILHRLSEKRIWFPKSVQKH
jgi:probable HAF family extracellular repeat protein